MAGGRDDDVLAFEITGHNAVFMCVLERLGDVDAEQKTSSAGSPPTGTSSLSGLAFQTSPMPPLAVLDSITYCARRRWSMCRRAECIVRRTGE